MDNPYSAPQNPTSGELYGDTPHTDAPKHSLLGVISFITVVVSGLVLFADICLAGYLEVTTPGGIDEESPITVVVGLVLIGMVLVNLLGGVLGFASFFESGKKKIFGILGFLFCGILVMGTIGLVVLGLVMQARGL